MSQQLHFLESILQKLWGVQMYICLSMFIIYNSKNWKHPKSLTLKEQLNKFQTLLEIN